MFMGGFNSVFASDHGVSSNLISDQELVDGCTFMASNNLNFVKTEGHFFSWHCIEEGKVKIMSRIDHYVVNHEW